MPIENDKPRAQLEKWIRLLGWRSRLRMHQHVVDEDAPPHLRGKVITWYEAGTSTGGQDHCCLQINEAHREIAAYEASIYAIRYRICTGWHRFRLYWTDEKLKQEASVCVNGWIGIGSPVSEGRRAFRRAHPECAGYTWSRIANEGPPR